MNKITPTQTRDNQKLGRLNGADLANKEFEKMPEIVPGLITQGLTLLAGKPKSGKSWMVLDIALAMTSTSHHYCLGHLEPEKGQVLYLALEDNEARLHNRIVTVHETGKYGITKDLLLDTECSRIDERLIEQLTEWHQRQPRAKLVIIDTLAGIRPRDENYRKDVYTRDYDALRELQKWTAETKIAALIVHHTRKQHADDPYEQISGSNGLTACADTNIVLQRSEQGTKLHIQGRDITERDHAIAFNPQTCRWTILGDANTINKSATRKEINTALQSGQTIKEIARQSGLPENTVKQHLRRGLKTGEYVKTGRGEYWLAATPPKSEIQ